MKYCVILSAVGCMGRNVRVVLDNLPTDDDLTYWEEYHSTSEIKYVAVNVFPIAGESL